MSNVEEMHKNTDKSAKNMEPSSNAEIDNKPEDDVEKMDNLLESDGLYDEDDTDIEETIAECSDVNTEMRNKNNEEENNEEINGIEDSKVETVELEKDAENVETKAETNAEESTSTTNEKEIMQLVEAILYASSRAVDVNEIAEITGASKAAVRRALSALVDWYESRPSALEIMRLPGERYLMQLRTKFSHRFSNIMPGGFLKMRELKTLALIALEQPVTQSRLVKARGSHVYSDLKRLEELGFIRREDDNRTKRLWTTDYFADYFGLDRDIKKMKLQFRARLRKWNVDERNLQEITSEE
ncbi:MAG: SMC-Scp complex subunit ScpB [Candidatus Korarchaeota archaeon]